MPPFFIARNLKNGLWLFIIVDQRIAGIAFLVECDLPLQLSILEQTFRL